MDLIIRNARLVRPAGGRPARHRREQMAASPRSSTDLAADAKVYDAGGHLACPGLIETHIHLDKSRIIDRCAPQERSQAQPGEGRHAAEEDP